MKTLFGVRNTTGEEWPAYAMGRLGAVITRDGRNADLPLYTLIKPDGADGIYVVNGASPLADDGEGTAIHYLDAQRVLVKPEHAVALDDMIGAMSGQWEAGRSGSQFTVIDEKNTRNVAPVVSRDSVPSKVTTIRFRIVGSDPADFVVLGFVLAWDGDGDFDAYDVQDDVNGPGMIPLGVVEVCDPMGTYFDEPADELFNRTGWARRMYSNSSDACNLGYPPFRTTWQVFALSCRRKVCRVF